MRTLALLLLAALLLAGCSGKDPASDSGSAASSTTTSTGPPPPPPVTTDTLHLLEAPEMATVLPDGSDESRTPFGGGGFGPGGGGQQEDAVWSYVVQTPVNVSSGEVRVWIEITEALVQSPFGFPGQPSCTWTVNLELGADNDVDVPCLTEPPGPIQAGTKELVFQFAGDTTQLEANETISISFGRNAFGPSLDPSVYVLSGSKEHDTIVQLDGLKEIVPEDD